MRKFEKIQAAIRDLLNSFDKRKERCYGQDSYFAQLRRRKMHAIEVLNIFQFPEGDEKKLDKVLEQFERYCNPRKNVVFERLQFWQITEEFRNRGSICHAFENKVKSCECWSVDDMVRDKFVFSGCEGTTAERRKAYIRESDLYGESV